MDFASARACPPHAPLPCTCFAEHPPLFCLPAAARGHSCSCAPPCATCREAAPVTALSTAHAAPSRTAPSNTCRSKPARVPPKVGRRGAACTHAEGLRARTCVCVCLCACARAWQCLSTSVCVRACVYHVHPRGCVCTPERALPSLRLCMCTEICVLATCTHTHAHTRTCTHARACTHAHKQTNKHTRIHVQAYARMHTHTNKQTKEHAHRHTHARTHARAHTHTHTHTHARMLRAGQFGKLNTAGRAAAREAAAQAALAAAAAGEPELNSPRKGDPPQPTPQHSAQSSGPAAALQHPHPPLHPPPGPPPPHLSPSPRAQKVERTSPHALRCASTAAAAAMQDAASVGAVATRGCSRGHSTSASQLGVLVGGGGCASSGAGGKVTGRQGPGAYLHACAFACL